MSDFMCSLFDGSFPRFNVFLSSLVLANDSSTSRNQRTFGCHTKQQNNCWSRWNHRKMGKLKDIMLFKHTQRGHSRCTIYYPIDWTQSNTRNCITKTRHRLLQFQFFEMKRQKSRFLSSVLKPDGNVLSWMILIRKWCQIHSMMKKSEM